MWPFIRSINLIRYLCVWRVNRPLVWLPDSLAMELSWVLGTLIAERLPASDARPWHKALATWGDRSPVSKKGPQTIPERPWPIEVVLFVYPGKRSYGQGEVLLWELKLLGESADHGLFLEVILPALEEAATTSDPRWHRARSLWGGFDVEALYVAYGPRWEPIVQEGRLDLNYRVMPTQWAEGLALQPESRQVLERLSWVTPFDLSPQWDASAPPPKRIPAREVPTLERLLEALVVRVAQLLPGKHNTPDDVWESLEAEERTALQEAFEVAARVPVVRHRLKRAPRDWPGRWQGTQTFQFIPPSLLPYLELASILHIGRQTHFGCGTFTLG